MKKLTVILGGIILSVVLILVGAIVWIKANLEEIVQDLTGKEVRFASVEFSYTPIPIVVLTDLSIKEGQHTVTIPRLKLYPDLTRILGGEVSLRKAVLDEPLVVVAGMGAEKETKQKRSAQERPAFSIDAIPDGVVVVNRGKFVAQADKGDALPVSLTAEAEKSDQRLWVQVHSAAIDEIGLTFTGKVTIDTFVPLAISIDAEQGAFNPAALTDFLRRFGYITPADAGRIPAIQQMEAKGLKINFNTATGHMKLAAASLDIDQVKLRDIAVELDDTGYTVSCDNGIVDAQNVYGWLQQNADTQEMVTGMLTQAKLKSLTPKGAIVISALRLKGSKGDQQKTESMGPVDGALELGVEGLILQLVGEKGQEQQLTISQLASKVVLEKGKAKLTVSRLAFDSSRGGSGSITGVIPLPVNLKQTTLNSSINRLKLFDTTLDLQLDKGPNTKTNFELGLDTPAMRVTADGRLYIPGRRKTDLEARLVNLRIATFKDRKSPQPAQKAPLDEPFDTAPITGTAFSAGAFVKTCDIDGLPVLKDVELQFKSGHKRAILHGSVTACDIRMEVSAASLLPGRVSATLEAKATDVDMSQLIACFSDELPVYLSGSVYLNGSFGTDGQSLQQMKDSLEGEVSVVATDTVVHRLSGLDRRLGFILDIVNTARIRPDQTDSLKLNRVVVNALLNSGKLKLDKATLTGPLVRAWGSGVFTLADTHLSFLGFVETVRGFPKKLKINRPLKNPEIDPPLKKEEI